MKLYRCVYKCSIVSATFRVINRVAAIDSPFNITWNEEDTETDEGFYLNQTL